MAARAPTSFTAYIDETQLVSRRQILTTEPNKVVNDQQFVIDSSKMLTCDVFPGIQVTTSGAAATIGRKFYVVGRDRCGLDATENYAFAIKAWSDSAVDFTVELYSNTKASGTSITVTANHTSKIWRGWSGAFALDSDGTENEIEIYASTSGVGGEIVVVGGFALFSP